MSLRPSTAEANSTVEVFDGTTSRVSKGTTMANSSGTWSTTLSAVSNGSHTYTAKAKDAANNTSDFSHARTVIVDTIKPWVLDPTTPLAGATGAAPEINVMVNFSEAMSGNTLRDPITLRSTTFTLARRNSEGTKTAVAAKVSYTETTTSTGAKVYRATLNPDANYLVAGATYIATVSTGAKDRAGNALDQDTSLSGNQPKTWTFTVRR